MTTVLITSAGGANGMNVLQALYRQKELKLKIVTADAQKECAAGLISKRHYVLPPAKSDKFLKELKLVIKKEKVDILMPMHSAEVFVLSQHLETLKSWGVKCGISKHETVELTWNKYKTAAFFEKHAIPGPRCYTFDEVRSGKAQFPLFAKPISASGSTSCFVIRGDKDLSTCVKPENIIFQQLLTGQEYTIDCLGDLNGKMVAASPRKRLEVRGGLSTKAITVAAPKLVSYGRKIMNTLGVVGPANIQCFVDKGKISFTEINTRFASGGLPLAIAAGFDIPLLLIKMLLKKPLGKIKIRSNIMMVRYYHALFATKKGSQFKLETFFHEFN